MSEIKVRWEFFLARTVAPIRGTVVVDDSLSDDEISLIVEDAAAEIVPSRISWEKEPTRPKARFAIAPVKQT